MRLSAKRSRQLHRLFDELNRRVERNRDKQTSVAITTSEASIRVDSPRLEDAMAYLGQALYEMRFTQDGQPAVKLSHVWQPFASERDSRRRDKRAVIIVRF